MSAPASSPDESEEALMHLASNRPSVNRLFIPTLEAEVVGPYMASRRRHYTDAVWYKLVHGMHTSHTLYVGNLSFFTREEQLHELFSRVAPVRRVIMGLNRETRAPCGFAFVEYFCHKDALIATNTLNGSKLDDRILKADLDAAFEEGRQYGRGKGGGQILDDHRSDFDSGRGGYGVFLQAKKEREEERDRIRKEQQDQFGAEDDQEEQEQEFDVETYGGGFRREAANKPFKLSQSTLAALIPGVFPHYALPVDDRVKKQLEQQLAEMKLSNANPNGTVESDNTNAAEAETAASKRPLSPAGYTSPKAGSSSPISKRPRITSPRAAAAGSLSPQPITDESHTPPPPHSPYPGSDYTPNSPGYTPTSPQSPAAGYNNRSRSHSRSPGRSRSRSRSYSRSRSRSRSRSHSRSRSPSRTPSPSEMGAGDDRTPPPRDDGDDEEHHMEDEHDRTPPPPSTLPSQSHPSSMRVDDDATPPPSP